MRFECFMNWQRTQGVASGPSLLRWLPWWQRVCAKRMPLRCHWEVEISREVGAHFIFNSRPSAFLFPLGGPESGK
jgi:hypothetical protein